jgi:glucose/mannose-6-phosphate isomerase
MTAPAAEGSGEDTDPTRRGIDTLGLYDAVAGLPEQVETAVAVAQQVEGLPDGEGVANVLLLGMGGSGAAGDVIAAMAQQFMAVPVVVGKGYDAPSFVAPDTLVIPLSFSGDTEETIQATEEAQVNGGTILAVCSGGRLAELAEDWGAPRLAVPADIPMPRAALGALVVPPLIALERMGLFPGAEEWVAKAVTQLKKRRDQLLADANPAAELARRIGRTLPVIYGAGAIGSVAASRWKTQVNENAKVPAFAGVVPEMCHNEISGWGQHGDLTRQVFQMILLRHDDEHPQESRRFELVAEILDEVMGAVHTVAAEGDGALAQLFDLVLFGDFLSLHLAGQEGIDPGPVSVLDDLKRALATP